MLIFMINKKIVTEKKANEEKTKAFGEYTSTQEIFVIPKSFISSHTQFVRQDNMLLKEMMSQCTAIKMD
jgi:hypothetical protein